MALFTSTVVMPVWIIGIIMLVPFILFVVTGILLALFVSIPECRTFFITSWGRGNRFVLFKHSSYSTASISSVRIDGVALSKKKGQGVIFKPRHKDDVEQIGKFRIMHVHELSPYPQSTTTAYVVDKTINALRTAGLPDDVSTLDALFRCRLDRKQMRGYIETEEYDEKEEPIVDKDGKSVSFAKYDANGLYIGEVPAMKKIKKQKIYQAQILEDDFGPLEEIKKKLENTFVGVDTDGGNIFAFNHLSKIVDIGIAATPGDVEDLEHEAERKGAMKSNKSSTIFATLAVAVVIIAIAAVVFLKGIGAV